MCKTHVISGQDGNSTVFTGSGLKAWIAGGQLDVCISKELIDSRLKAYVHSRIDTWLQSLPSPTPESREAYLDVNGLECASSNAA